MLDTEKDKQPDHCFYYWPNMILVEIVSVFHWVFTIVFLAGSHPCGVAPSGPEPPKTKEDEDNAD